MINGQIMIEDGLVHARLYERDAGHGAMIDLAAFAAAISEVFPGGRVRIDVDDRVILDAQAWMIRGIRRGGTLPREPQ